MQKKIRNYKDKKRQKRHWHIRHTVVGTADRPRVCVFRSNMHIYAQIVDDEQGRTLVAVSSLKMDPPKAAPAPEETGDKGKKKKKGGKKPKAPDGAGILQAIEVGRKIAEVAKENGITRIRFDRGGYLYHGRVAALAGAMRKGGLEF